MSSQTNQAKSLNFLQNVGLYKLVTTSQIVIQTLDNKYPDPGAILFMGPSGNVQYANDLTIPGVFKPLEGLFGTTATFSNTLTAGSLFLADYGIFNGLLTALGGLSTTTGYFTELIFGSVISGPTATFNTLTMSGPIVGQAANFAGPLIAAGGLYATAAATFTGPVTFESNIIGYDAIFTNSVLSTGVLRSNGIFTNTGLILGQDATFTGLLTALGGFSGGTATFSGVVNADAGIIATTAVIQNISGGTATFSEVVTFNGGLVGLAGTFSGLLTANGGLLVTGGMSVNGGTTFNGSVAATGGIICGGTFTSTGTIVAVGANFSGAVSVNTLTAGAANFNSAVTAMAGIVISVPNSLETAWINNTSRQLATFGGPAIIPRLTVPTIDGCVDMNPSGNALTIYGSVIAPKTINASTVSVSQILGLGDVNSTGGTTLTIGGTVDFKNYYTLNGGPVLEPAGTTGISFLNTSTSTVADMANAWNSLLTFFSSRRIFVIPSDAPPPTPYNRFFPLFPQRTTIMSGVGLSSIIGSLTQINGIDPKYWKTNYLLNNEQSFIPDDFDPSKVWAISYSFYGEWDSEADTSSFKPIVRLRVYLSNMPPSSTVTSSDPPSDAFMLVDASTLIDNIKRGIIVSNPQDLTPKCDPIFDRIGNLIGPATNLIAVGTPISPTSRGTGQCLDSLGNTFYLQFEDANDRLKLPGYNISRINLSKGLPVVGSTYTISRSKLSYMYMNMWSSKFTDKPWTMRNIRVGQVMVYYKSFTQQILL